MKEIVEAKFKLSRLFRLDKLLEFLVSMSFMSIALIMFNYTQGSDILLLALGLFFVGVSVIPIFLFLNYVFSSGDETIVFFQKEGYFTVGEALHLKKYNYKEVRRIEIFSFTEDLGRIHFNYSYAKYFLPNSKILTINNLMIDGGFVIPNGIEPILVEQLFPIIDETNKEWPKKKTEKEVLKNDMPTILMTNSNK
ncbi:MAG: hypothetical protein RIE59_11575 [Imperialibacter sp.]